MASATGNLLWETLVDVKDKKVGKRMFYLVNYCTGDVKSTFI